VRVANDNDDDDVVVVVVDRNERKKRNVFSITTNSPFYFLFLCLFYFL